MKYFETHIYFAIDNPYIDSVQKSTLENALRGEYLDNYKDKSKNKDDLVISTFCEISADEFNWHKERSENG